MSYIKVMMKFFFNFVLKGYTNDWFLLFYRIHWSFKKKSLTRGGHQMWRKICKSKSSKFLKNNMLWLCCIMKYDCMKLLSRTCTLFWFETDWIHSPYQWKPSFEGTYGISQVNSILRHVGELMKFHSDEQMEELYTKTAWFFDDKYKKPGASYEAFKHAVT